MPDLKLKCIVCKNEFPFTESEQEFYQRQDPPLQKPKRCKNCRQREARYIDTDAIVAFVQKVEEKKSYQRDIRLVFAHIVEESGELASALYKYEREASIRDYPDPVAIGRELIDIIFLAAYMADILRIDLNKQIPSRMEEICIEYNLDG